VSQQWCSNIIMMASYLHSLFKILLPSCLCVMFVTDYSMSIAFYIQYTIQKKECTMICLFSYVQYE